jgi:hypothetical protein
LIGDEIKHTFMKRTILIIGLLSVAFCFNAAYCQLKNGEYVKNDNINRIVGTWIWQSGDTTFTIVLKKEKVTVNNPVGSNHFDVLQGWHEYAVKGKIIESSIASKKLTLTNGFQNQELRLPVSGDFEDLTRNKFGEARFDLLPGEKDKIEWHLIDREWAEYPGFTVPTNIIMVRVKDPQ